MELALKPNVDKQH